MPKAATTKLSSRGQVVIPETVRTRLGLRAGDEFVVVGDKDTIVLKKIKAPRLDDFDHLIREARRQARSVGLKRSDLSDVIHQVRAEKAQ